MAGRLSLDNQSPFDRVLDALNMTDLFPRIEFLAHRLEDDRGFLEVLYESSSAVLKRSFSHKFVFRGLHWQDDTAPQAKIIRVISGKIADFVVDMRDPFRAIHHNFIDPADGWVLIEPCYAHGLFALEDTLFEYFCDGGYNESAEHAFLISEHIKKVLGVDKVILSPKDTASSPL
jgi:dTDP-4-dehydrorhamnose 3,5-epimerase